MHDVAVGDDVLLALQPQLAGIAGAGLAAERDVVGIGDGFGADETLFKVGMDDAGGGGRLGAAVDGPGPRLLGPDGEIGDEVEQRAAEEGAASVVISAKIEAEIAVLPRDEREMFLSEIGLKEPGLDRLINAGYALLDLVTYFTAGPKETRAWTITHGTKAPQAAGVIHTDFERGFIRAETIAYDDYVALGGEAGARDGGKLRLEGKDYVVADGDVMHFRFAT